MKLTKVDIAQTLGMIYIGEDLYSLFYIFEFRGKQILLRTYRNLDEAWEEAAEKLLEPLADYLLGNLDDDE